MKTIKVFLLSAILMVSLVSGAISAYEGNNEKAATCFLLSIAALAIPVEGLKLNRGSLGFLNKSYFTKDDDPYTRAELALLQYIASTGKGQSQIDAQLGNLKLETYARAFRFVIPNAYSGRRELLNGGSQFIQGAIPEEWNLGQLPDGYNVAVSHIRVGFVADAVIATGQAGVAYGSQPNAWVSALRNGQLIFSQAGAIKCFVDVVATGTMAAGFGSIGENDGLELQTPFILEENKATKFELYGASGQSFGSPAGGNLLEIILFGSMIRLRA